MTPPGIAGHAATRFFFLNPLVTIIGTHIGLRFRRLDHGRLLVNGSTDGRRPVSGANKEGFIWNGSGTCLRTEFSGRTGSEHG